MGEACFERLMQRLGAVTSPHRGMHKVQSEERSVEIVMAGNWKIQNIMERQTKITILVEIPKLWAR